jgi:di/tricarboxylate transporter
MDHQMLLILLAASLILFAMEILRPDIIGMIVMVVLILTGTVNIDEGFSGFSNPAVITVIAMFILTAGLERTGVGDVLGNLMFKTAGNNPALLTITVMATVGLLSSIMNNIGATVVLLTPIYAICKKINYPPSKLLIPLSFGSLLGGLTTLIGTPPNLLVSMALEDAGFEGFKMFDFLPTGAAVLATGVLYMTFIGRHLIPVRKGTTDYTQTYNLEDYMTEVIIPAGSSIANLEIQYAKTLQNINLIIISIRRKVNDEEIDIIPQNNTVLKTGDRLLIEGNLEKLFKVIETKDLIIHIKTKINDSQLTGKGMKLAEVVPSPQSSILGQTIRQANIKSKYGVLALALKKREKQLNYKYVDLPLEVGDVILVQGTASRLNDIAKNSDFLVINQLEPKFRETSKAPYALLCMAFAIISAATGLLHISVAGIIGVIMMVMLGVVRVDDIYKNVEWRVIFLIACMMPFGIAMDNEHTGAAAWIANHIVNIAGPHGPYVVMGCLLLVVTLITEVMSNAAAAVLIAPIGISIAVAMNIQPHPFLMAIAIGASTTFLTPIGHQANVLVYGIGGYKFSDFARTGFLLNVFICLVAFYLIPIVWPFTPIK